MNQFATDAKLDRAADYYGAVANTPPRVPMPAEACTELGIHTKPTPPNWWRRLRIALLRFHVDCLVDEREHYLSLGWVGPVYLRESYSTQFRLMTRIRELEAQP